SKYGLQD
nr:Chain B, Nuclear pore complex protein Nup96 [synthetic construct]2Q5Y_D Chain D, Nuclear pore complex protein Nup96 [synthetic construct]